MNKKLFLILLSIGLLVLANTESAYSQLLEDRNKLKTAKRERKPFSLFKNNIRKPAKSGQKPEVVRASPTRTSRDVAGKGSDRRAAPRYSQRKEGKRERYTGPRYTQDKAGQQGRKYDSSPRFTQDKAGQQGKKYDASPRFTQDKAGQQGKKYDASPRFTQDKAGQQGRKYVTSPRFTQDKAGQQGKKYDVSPRFTQDKAGQQGRKYVTSPRFTQEIAGQQGRKKISPRFSSPSNWKEEKKAPPRFTQDIAGQGYERMKINPRFSVRDQHYYGNKKVKPRFSKPPAYIDNPASGQRKGFMLSIQLFQPKPRYKQGKESNFFGPSVKQIYFPSNSMAKHNQTIQSYQKYISRGGKSGPYAEQTNHLGKMKKMKRPKNAHPSANYLTAKYDNSEVIREGKRKFNIIWVRAFGNKTQPKGVKKKPGKSKYDKDEKDLWNNKEREYTRN